MRPPAPAHETVGTAGARAALTVTAAAGASRFFTDASTAVPLAGAALAVHLAAGLARRRGLGAPARAAVILATTAVAAAWLVVPETTVFGIPGPRTWGALAGALGSAASGAAGALAPVAPADGYLAAGVVGVAMAAAAADALAARAAGAGLVAAPSFALFVLTAVLGAERHRSASAGLYLAALAVFLVLHRPRQRTGGEAPGGWRAGAVVGTAAVVAAVSLGPHLPGAGARPLVALRPADRAAATRSTVASPLVDVRTHLVERPRAELFRVRTEARSYWRLTALDSYDGEEWSLEARYAPAGPELPPAPGPRPPADPVEVDFAVGALGSVWLPAAYRPERVDGAGAVGFHAASASLVAGSATSDGLRYRVRAGLPRFSASRLRAAPEPAPGPALEPFLRVPEVPAAVAALARHVAAGSDGTPYGRARAVQDFLRQGFAHDLGAPPGHDVGSLESFLLETRRGYSEQFAAAYGLLARLAGLPTRVAVGFTPGEPAGDRLVVRGADAHAWPEVFLAGSGWVPFEPTPGRGMPGGEDHTGVPEVRAGPAGPAPAAVTAPAVTARIPPSLDDEDISGTPAAAKPRLVTLGRVALAALRLAAGAALLLAAAVAAAAVARGAARWRRRAAARSPAERVLLAWREAAGALAAAGAPRSPGETLAEHARRAGALLRDGDAGRALRSLADAASAACYAGRPVREDAVARAVAASGAVRSAAREATSRHRRWSAALDPRPAAER